MSRNKEANVTVWGGHLSQREVGTTEAADVVTDSSESDFSSELIITEFSQPTVER